MPTLGSTFERPRLIERFAVLTFIDEIKGIVPACIEHDPPMANLPPGQVLKVDDQIDVPAGALLTLLGDDGTVATVGGPQRLVVTAEPELDLAEAIKTRTTFQRISDLLLGSPDDGEVLGGRRSVGQSADGKDIIEPWALPVGYSGNGCLRNNAIELRRAKDLEERPVSVSINGETETSASHWPKNQNKLELPSLASGHIKTVEIRLGNEVTTFNIHMLPTEIEPGHGMDVLAWMLESGCRVQAISFARWLAQN